MKNILIALAATTLFSSIHLSSNAEGDDKQKNEKERVGRYQIEIVKKGEDHIIYRLDSFTGNVSVFDPNEDEILSLKDIENLEPRMKRVAEKLLSEHKILIANPYWKSIPEKYHGFRIIGN